MLFIHPMWDNESQRIGMRKCWKTAYLVHAYGELVGFLGLLTLLITVGYMVYSAIFVGFRHSMWWLLCVPFGIGIVSEVMVRTSWAMVERRGFEYDYRNRVSSWVEDGQTVSYRYAQESDRTDAS